MSGVPYTFGTATTSIPLSNLDSNFVTPVTIGNASVALGNTITAIGNLTLNNVTINSGTSNISANITLGNTTISLGNTATTIGNLTLTNPTIIGGTSNVTSTSITNGTSNVAVLSSNSNVTSYVNGVLQSTLFSSGLSLVGSLNSINTFGFKNRIINGAMVIDQRNAGASGTAQNAYTVDRWKYVASQASKGTWGQNLNSVTPPAGFTNYLGFTSSSAYSVLAGDYFAIQQVIEGYNMYDFGWGTANAKAVTISAWVYSSLTGTFGGALQINGLGQCFPFSYSIPVANTWTYVTINIAGDTAGTWNSTNGAGVYVAFSLGAGSSWTATGGAWTVSNAYQATGSTSVVGTSGATFYITGVQLEVGSQATSFDFRSYGTELALCQRYLPAITGNGNNAVVALGQCTSASGAVALYIYPVTPRTVPTGIILSSASNFSCWQANTAGTTPTGITLNNASYTAATLQMTGMSGLVAGNATALVTAVSSGSQILFTGCEL
jgi:hypothetical protein